MKYNININQTKCIEFWLNLQQWAIMDIMWQLSTWADPISTEQWIYYYLSSWKLVDELPIISDNKDTFQKNIKTLKDKLLLDHYYDIKNSKWYYRLSDKWKTFILQEKNPGGSGKKSLPPQEKNPDNNITNYNIHSLTSNEVNSFINNSFTNELLVKNNNDIVELENKKESFVNTNNKDSWVKNNNWKNNKKHATVVKSFDDTFLLEKYNNPIMKLLLKYLRMNYIKQSFDNDKVLDVYSYIKEKTMQSHKLVDNNTWKVKIQDLCNLLETMFIFYEIKWASNIKNCFNTFYTNFHKERIPNNK